MRRRRMELQEAKALYEDKLIASPALSDMQEKAVQRYQVDIEDHRSDKVAEKVRCRLREEKGADFANDSASPAEASKKRKKAATPSFTPRSTTTSGSKTRTTISGPSSTMTLEEMTTALLRVYQASTTSLYTEGAFLTFTALLFSVVWC